jgi:hypothetical protein
MTEVLQQKEAQVYFKAYGGPGKASRFEQSSSTGPGKVHVSRGGE